MIIDFKTLFGGQCAPINTKIINLAHVVLQGRHIHFEAKGIAFGEQIKVFTLDDVLFFIGKQIFLNRQALWRRFFKSLGLVIGKADPVIEGASPFNLRNFFHALFLFRVHKFAADVADSNKCEIIIELFEPIFFFFLELHRIAVTVDEFFEVFNFHIAFDDLKSGADFMDTVENRFEFDCLIDHIFGSRDFSAIV